MTKEMAPRAGVQILGVHLLTHDKRSIVCADITHQLLGVNVCGKSFSHNQICHGDERCNFISV